MRKNLLARLGGLLAAGLLSGCAVYVPTTPTTPLLRQQGEAEVNAALRSFPALELSGAWSPARRLLLTAEGAWQGSSGSKTRNNVTTTYQNNHWQGGVGLGTYRLLGAARSTYLGAVAGVGWARADVYDANLDKFFLILPLYSPIVHYEARYFRYYGQVYVAQQRSPRFSYGLSWRTTGVQFQQLLRAGQPIDPLTRVFFEPHAFMRLGRGALQAQLTAGLSLPGPTGRLPNPDRGTIAPTSLLLSGGVVLRPHLLGHREPLPSQ